MARAPNMKDLQTRLDAIERDIEKLQAQRELILELLGQEPEPSSARAPKGSVKKAVLDLLEEAKENGLNANQAVALAKKNGTALDRGSVSSLLSRLKSDDVVAYDGEQYRLKKYARKQVDDPTITHFRTSGGPAFG